MTRLPFASFVISLLALLIALGGAGYSATGGNFILGKANSASTQTKLVTPLNGAAFRIDNTSPAASATGMTIVTNAARPPLAVNSSVKVANLNADKLDGLDSTQFANKLVVPFNLAGGAITAPIIVPPNQPVFHIGVTTTSIDPGVGHMTLLRVPDLGLFWVGLESPSATITAGNGAAAGTHIGYIDFSQVVDVEVNSANTIRIHNESLGTLSGIVTLLW